MTTDLTSDIQLSAIAANLSALQVLLRDAATRSAEALGFIQHGERQGAIGALVGLDSVLDNSYALFVAALALHRLKTRAAASSSSVSTPVPTAQESLAQLTPTTPGRASDKDCAHKLIDTINHTGGLVAFANGTYGPQCDPDWLDLGDAYLAACHEKGVEPRINRDIDPEQAELPV